MKQTEQEVAFISLHPYEHELSVQESVYTYSTKRPWQQKILQLLMGFSFLVVLGYTFRIFCTNHLQVLESIPDLKKINAVNISVYYETLSPDSKDFIKNQLIPVHRKIPNLIRVELIPYGKAVTSTEPDGSLKFECQHGERECEGNIIHACGIDFVNETAWKLTLIDCMIGDKGNPYDTFNECAPYKVNVGAVRECYSGSRGKELLKIAGEATDALRPQVTFIPTVTINGQQRRQSSILTDLLGEVCRALEESGTFLKVCAPPTTL